MVIQSAYTFELDIIKGTVQPVNQYSVKKCMEAWILFFGERRTLIRAARHFRKVTKYSEEMIM